MKNVCFVLFTTILFANANAQLTVKSKCADFYVDILDGKVNGIKPNFGYEEIKEKLPCFTSADPEGPSSKCGGGIYFKDKDVYFYTGRDYVEIKEKFKGKLSIPLMGASRNSLFKWLGNPKLKDTTWEAFSTAYGILVLYYNKAGKVNLIQFSTNSAETLKLCQ